MIRTVSRLSFWLFWMNIFSTIKMSRNSTDTVLYITHVRLSILQFEIILYWRQKAFLFSFTHNLNVCSDITWNWNMFNLVLIWAIYCLLVFVDLKIVDVDHIVDLSIEHCWLLEILKRESVSFSNSQSLSLIFVFNTLFIHSLKRIEIWMITFSTLEMNWNVSICLFWSFEWNICW